MLGARTLAVNYHDVPSTVELLEKNKIEIIISTLNTIQSPEAEMSLIKAADKSFTTKRYIPSAWGIPYTEE